MIDTKDNLSEMVKQGPTEEGAPIVFYEEIDFEEVKACEMPMQPTDVTEEVQDPNIIKITQLTPWFKKNVCNFPNIRKPTVVITGVDPDKQLLVTVPDENSEQRKLVIFNDADVIPVLDRPAMDMQIFNNGFRIIYDLGDEIFAKCYEVRTGLVTVFCNDIDNILVPYAMVRAKRKDEDITIIRNNPEEVRSKLQNPLDLEALQLRYKQSSKATEELTTNMDAIKWLTDRQATIEDTNHHLQIDNVIIETLA